MDSRTGFDCNNLLLSLPLKFAHAQQLAGLTHAGLSYRGYQRLGANVTRYEKSFQRDWHEAIDLYREVPSDMSVVCILAALFCFCSCLRCHL